MHQYCRPMPLKIRNSFRLQNLVNVTLSIEICFPSAHNATPYNNTPTSKSVPLNETIISKTFPSSSLTWIWPSWWLKVNLDSSENRTRAHCCRPQRKCHCAYCKRAARWRPVSTCPTSGLLGRMGCRACLRRRNTVCLLILYCLAELVTIWKRRQRCVSIINLGLPGLRRYATPPVCWKRWRNQIIVFLWQPNALLM